MGQKERKRKAKVSCFDSCVELGKRKSFIIGVPMVVVVDCSLIILFSPMDAFTSVDVDEELGVASDGLAVDVHDSFHGLSGIEYPLAESEVDLDGRILVDAAGPLKDLAAEELCFQKLKHINYSRLEIVLLI